MCGYGEESRRDLLRRGGVLLLLVREPLLELPRCLSELELQLKTQPILVRYFPGK